MSLILALETSCDDTAAAIIDDRATILAEVTFAQMCHAQFGGVVPEVGSRAHIEQIRQVVEQAFGQAQIDAKDITAVAATFAPGLLGPLLVGAHFAKGFALARNVPLVCVHHIEGHILAGFGERGFPSVPFVSLIASGGHTSLYRCDADYTMSVIGQTLDDAAGEAFDKIGRSLGLPYPAGKIIDELAAQGDRHRFLFPIAMKSAEHFNFSFSGLKTSASELLRKHGPMSDQERADFCASLQEAVVLALGLRAIRAVRTLGLHDLVVGGGVAANSRLRSWLTEACSESNIRLFLPAIRHCTDNAVMIARAALVKLHHGRIGSLGCDVFASLSIEDKHLLDADAA